MSGILAIGAHPDDIELGCGGTLFRHKLAGDRISLLVATHGEQAGSPDVRIQEQRTAASLLGAQLYFMGMADTLVPYGREAIMEIERYISTLDPELIYVCYGDDTHQDHRNLYQATLPAARSVRSLLCYETLSTQGFAPLVYADIGETMDSKMELLAAHDSQASKTHIDGATIMDIARSVAAFRGIQGRVRHAEGFVPVRYYLHYRF